MPLSIYCVDVHNREEYKTKTLEYLCQDFYDRHQPSNHFWYHRRAIVDAFNQDTAMVVLDRLKNLVAFMIWHVYHRVVVKIVMVEVRRDYRQRGLFDIMIREFSHEFKEVSLLVALVVPEAYAVFGNSSKWKEFPGMSESEAIPAHLKRYVRFINQPLLQSSHRLPNGPVIAILSNNNCLNGDPAHMQYFSVEPDEQGRLKQPVVANFYRQQCCESYVGIYLDRQLIQGCIAEHIFKNRIAFPHIGLLIIDQIIPCDPVPFEKIGFFKHVVRERSNQDPMNQENPSCSGYSMDFGGFRSSFPRGRFREREKKQLPYTIFEFSI